MGGAAWRGLAVAAILLALLGVSSCNRVASVARTTSVPPQNGEGTHQYQSDEVLRSYLDKHRDETQHPDEVMRLMHLGAGERIADIGAGSGYFTWHFSRAVGSDGMVYAVDVDPQAIDFLTERMKTEPPPFDNIRIVRSDFSDTRLPSHSVNWGFLCEAHFFVDDADAGTRGCLLSLRRAMKPGGGVAVIEARQDPLRGRISLRRLEAPFLAAGFKVEKVIDMYAKEYFVIFRARPTQ